MATCACGRHASLATTERRWSILALLGAAALLSGVHGFKSKGEIGSSILVMGPSDYMDFGGGSRCHKMVETAAKLKQSRINFTPSLYWVDEQGEKRKSVNSAGQVTHWCYTRTFPTEKAHCAPATETERLAFRDSMASCFQMAIKSGLSLAVTPHVDDGLGLGGWRNGLVFDPLKKYGNYSYAEFMLYPLADALNSVIQESTTVTFALQGEMSATVFYHPLSYEKLLPKIKSRVLAGKPAAWQDNVETGLSTNFDKLCGCVLQDMIDPSEYLKEFPAAFESQKKYFDTKAIAKAYSVADFIGISNYASMRPNFDIKELESATFQFAREASYFGVDVKDLIFNKGKKLYWMEYGVGGGRSQMGNVKATTATEAAATPFFGVFGDYNAATDPWKVAAIRDYMHYFYSQTINYLRSEGTCDGCAFRVDQVYLWNDGSWDIQAIYPESHNAEGSYRDDFAVALIESHNDQAMTGGCACSDTPSKAKMSCVDEVAINLCSEAWYIIGDFCQTSCNRCFCNGACSDSPPDNRYSCKDQAEWGQCSEAFMSGYCRKSCKTCTPSAADVGVDAQVTLARKHAAALAKGGDVSDFPSDEGEPTTVQLAPVPAPAWEAAEAPATLAPAPLPVPVAAPSAAVPALSEPAPAPGAATPAPAASPGAGAAHSVLPPAPVASPEMPSVEGIIPLAPSQPFLVRPGSIESSTLAEDALPSAAMQGVRGSGGDAAPGAAPAPIVVENRHVGAAGLEYPTSDDLGDALDGKGARLVTSWAVKRSHGAHARAPALLTGGWEQLGGGVDSHAAAPAPGAEGGEASATAPGPATSAWERLALAGDFHAAATAAIEEWREEAEVERQAARALATAPAPASLTSQEVEDLAAASTVVYKSATANGLVHGSDTARNTVWSQEMKDPQTRKLLWSPAKAALPYASAAAPAPEAQSAAPADAKAGTRSWLDLVREGDLSLASDVAMAEYNQMTESAVQTAGRVRPGGAGVEQDENALAEMTQANRLAATSVMALQAWQAAEAANTVAAAPTASAPVAGRARTTRVDVAYDAPLPPFAVTRANALGAPTVQARALVWRQTGVLTDADAAALIAEKQPPQAPAPTPGLALPFAYVDKAAAAVSADDMQAPAFANGVSMTANWPSRGAGPGPSMFP